MTRSVVTLKAGRLSENVDEAEKALLKDYARVGLYQRGDFLVQAVVATADDDPRKYVRRPPGSVILRTATATSLQDMFDREITWAREDKDGKSYVVDCPFKVPQRYLSRVGNWHLPVLVGVVEAPVMRPDGSMLTTRVTTRAPGCFYSRQSRGRTHHRTPIMLLQPL
jgi:putative DNA primase/helicase